MTLKISVLLAAVLQVIGAAYLSIGTFEQNVRDVAIYIQPAGWTFSIWGLIYLLSFVYAVYQIIPGNENSLLQKTRWPALLGFLGSILWLLFAGMSNWLVWLTIPTLLLMAFLFTLIVRADSTENSKTTFFSKTILLPYAAWTAIAAWVNVQAVLVDEGFVAGGIENVLSNLALLTGILLFTSYYFRKSNFSAWYGGVLIWASVGLFYANYYQNESLLFSVIAGLFGFGVLAVLMWQGKKQGLKILT